MTEEYNDLKRFMENFLENERYLPELARPLDAKEIENIARNKAGLNRNRDLADRLLNDPEAMEILIDLKEEKANQKGKILKIPINKRDVKASGVLTPVTREKAKKAAASANLQSQLSSNAFQINDDRIKGYVQITEYKNEQFIVSGHLTLASTFRYLKLILPDGTNINEFRVEDDKLIFRETVPEWIDITEIQYELY